MFLGLNSTGNEVSTIAPTTLTPCAAIRCGFFATCEVINGSASCECSQSCGNVSQPVCGSDGVTYENICELEKSSCQKAKHITVVKQGMCGKCESGRCLFFHPLRLSAWSFGVKLQKSVHHPAIFFQTL